MMSTSIMRATATSTLTRSVHDGPNQSAAPWASRHFKTQTIKFHKKKTLQRELR